MTDEEYIEKIKILRATNQGWWSILEDMSYAHVGVPNPNRIQAIRGALANDRAKAMRILREISDIDSQIADLTVDFACE